MATQMLPHRPKDERWISEADAAAQYCASITDDPVKALIQDWKPPVNDNEDPDEDPVLVFDRKSLICDFSTPGNRLPDFHAEVIDMHLPGYSMNANVEGEPFPLGKGRLSGGVGRTTCEFLG